MLDYNPLIQPFELPVQKLVAHCISEVPLFFLPSYGATPGTSLGGTFGQMLKAIKLPLIDILGNVGYNLAAWDIGRRFSRKV